MRSKLSIGEFATVDALERADVAPLPRGRTTRTPPSVDPFTGYRYYPGRPDPDGAGHPPAPTCSMCRWPRWSRSFPPTIRSSGPRLIAGHLRRLEAELNRTQAAVVSLRRLLRPNPADVAGRAAVGPRPYRRRDHRSGRA